MIDYSEIVKETKAEEKLKLFFKKMINITGYDYTLLSTTQDLEVKPSLVNLTSSLDEFTNEDLSLALIKSAIISGETTVPFVNELIEKKNYEELNQLINFSIVARRAVTHEFIMNCNCSNENLVSKSHNRKAILKRLKSFKIYEEDLIEKESKGMIKEKKY